MSKHQDHKNSTSAANKQSSRRRFLKTAGLTASAVAVPYFWTSPRAYGRSVNDRLQLGAIGTSIYTNRYTGDGDHPGRGAVVGHQAAKFGEMIAVADVNRKNAEFFAKNYKDKCQIYNDYQELLARDDVDAVTIGTPDHWHAKIAIDAMRAGKHVYCEKPLSLTIREGQQVCKVATETGKIFQVGTQQRSEFKQVFLKAVAIAQSGMLGDKLDCLISVAQGKKAGRSRTNPHRTTWIGIAGWARPPRCRIARDAAIMIFAGGWNTVAVR